MTVDSESTAMHSIVRPASDRDADAIRAVLTAAFGGSDEAKLVADLHRRTDCWSLVATPVGDETDILGVITFSPVHGRRPVADLRAAGLAPMAVRPDRQRLGIGSTLVRAGIDACRRRNVGLIVVLGHPSYYPRFGFAPAAAIGLRCKWSHDDESFMFLELTPGQAALAGDFVSYAPEFDGF